MYPALEGFYLSSDMGRTTLQKLLGVNHWVVLIALAVMAGGMFFAMERFEKRAEHP